MEVKKHKATGVLKSMIEHINKESLEKTRKEMEEELRIHGRAEKYAEECFPSINLMNAGKHDVAFHSYSQGASDQMFMDIGMVCNNHTIESLAKCALDPTMNCKQKADFMKEILKQAIQGEEPEINREKGQPIGCDFCKHCKDNNTYCDINAEGCEHYEKFERRI